MRRRVLAFGLLGVLGSAGTMALAIDVQVATTKPSYYPGEDIRILISVTNPATLHFPSTLQSLYTLDGYTPSLLGLAILTQVTTPYTWTMSHAWSDYRPVLGTHWVIGSVVEYGDSSPVSFSIVAPPTPRGNFLVDFDLIPGTTAAVAHPLAYELCGVRFHTALGAECRLQNVVGDSWLEGFDPYPTGFNIAVDFAMPVFGARVQVAGGTGVKITMVAKDAQGQTIASAKTPAITQPGQFAQTLSVTTTRPIASLEWWPSIPNSLVAIDNLSVHTVPPLSYEVLGQNLRLSWPTVTGSNYQLWSSPDLRSWTPYASARAGTGDILNQECVMSGVTRMFFRLSQGD